MKSMDRNAGFVNWLTTIPPHPPSSNLRQPGAGHGWQAVAELLRRVDVPVTRSLWTVR